LTEAFCRQAGSYMKTFPPEHSSMIAIRFWIAMLILLGFLPAVFAAAPDDTDFFEKKVRPLLVEKCQSCHGAEKQKGNLRVDSKAALLAGGDRGAAVVPGKPDESLIVRVLAHDGDVKMPPKNKLPNAEIAVFKEWVQRGAAWPDSKAVVAAPKAMAASREFTAEERNFWAFQPVRPQPVPATASHPVDAFLLAKLKERNLSFAPPADRRTLIRRITFDLTGLPPTAAEVDAFVKDDSKDAYEKLVDRLLASSAYGEKWGRRWLDVARYADSNGMDENLAYVNAWRYRDWVIKAFNSDKPYDEFVRDQIAGDLVPGGTDAERAERMTATGFLVIGPKMLAEDDPMKMRMDIIDEQLDTAGQAFLGLTLGCARCHDHKFDPITAADYYGLAGMFYSTKTMVNYNVVATWNERPIGSPESIAKLAEHKKSLDKLKAEIAKVEKAAKADTAKRLIEERKRAKEYATAAMDVHRRRGPLKLVAADPSKRSDAIIIESEAYARGNVLKLTDGYGAGIGVIINAGPIPNFTEHDIDIKKAGTFQVAVRYAAADPRPVRILVNGKIVAGDACGTRTGSWNPDGQKWHAEATVELPVGKAVIRFERDGAIPHLDKFALVPMTADEIANVPLLIERVATDRKLSASLLRQWVEVISKRDVKLLANKEIESLALIAEGPFRQSKDFESEGPKSTELKRLRETLASAEKTKPPVDEVMAVEDAKAENLKIHLRGNHLTLGAEAPRRLPRILAGEAPLSLKSGSGRLELAEWMTRSDNPLTARVMVNRIWAGHFGTGLVRTPDNFGRLGERPTHPELLDWLAAEFVRSKWSVKQMHRLIVTSNVYKMTSGSNPNDPENRLYSHFNRRRLDAEEIRDGMLAVAGQLERTSGGTMLKATPRQYVTSTANVNYNVYSSPRRTVYLPVVRSAVYDVLQTLDFADPSVPNGQRTATTIPTQALFMLNSTLVDETAEAFAKSLLSMNGSDDDRIRAAYHRAFGRTATESELVRVRSYLKKSEASVEAKRLKAWRGLFRVLFASNEFVFVE
jgi:Protein of unknown function (DUF1553)/Protein of unknown function (DUF1549)/Planctomycete cytochrome C